MIGPTLTGLAPLWKSTWPRPLLAENEPTLLGCVWSRIGAPVPVTASDVALIAVDCVSTPAACTETAPALAVPKTRSPTASRIDTLPAPLLKLNVPMLLACVPRLIALPDPPTVSVLAVIAPVCETGPAGCR